MSTNCGKTCHVNDQGDLSPPENEETEFGISKEVKVGKPQRCTIMVAGKVRNGKTTALNNIFCLDLPARPSPMSVTRTIRIIKVKKKVPRQTNDTSPGEVKMQVIDTPGLGALDIPKEKILEEIKTATKGVKFTLLYCFSVGPNTILTETDKNIMTHLTHAFGEEVWSNCVLLLTFSDNALLEFKNSPAKYVRFIDDHAKLFQELLQKITGKKISVNNILEYKDPQTLSEDENSADITAIPVKKIVAHSEDILPRIIKPGQDWTDVAFLEIIKKADPTYRKEWLILKYPNIFITLGTIVAGGAAGATAGGIVGALAGPIGVPAGAAAGAAIGLAAGVFGGGMAGLTVKRVVELVKFLKK